MKTYELWAICDLTAGRIQDRYYPFLLLGADRISEPDARHVMTKVLEERGLSYEFEVRTPEKYPRFGRGEERSALVDLAIHENRRGTDTSTWVEFKRGLPGEYMIEKDFIKLMIEPNIDLAGFFHILPAPNRKRTGRKPGPIQVIFDRYQKAYTRAVQDLTKSSDNRCCRQKRFLLFIHDFEEDRSYFVYEPNLCAISELKIPWAQVIWKESDDIERGFGHGVEFLYGQSGEASGRTLIAIIRGYEWRSRARNARVTIEIRPLNSDVLRKFNNPPVSVIEEVKFAVLNFLQAENQSGYITENVSTWFNG